MSAATPIRPGADCQATKLRDLQPAVKEALTELQARVWGLRNLIQAVQLAEREGNAEDLDAAANGLVDLADTIHLALDPDAVAEQAQRLADRRAHQEAREGTD